MNVTPKFITETQNFRFIPSVPINHDDAIALASGTRAGDYVVVSHEQPRATYVIEPGGSVLVHGLSRGEVAELAVQELLLTMGLPLEGLSASALLPLFLHQLRRSQSIEWPPRSARRHL